MPVTPAYDPEKIHHSADAASAVTPYRRIVQLAAGTIRHAAADEAADGVVEEGVTAEQIADSMPASFTSLNAPGTFVMVAAAAITAGAAVYAAADGKVSATGDIFEGIAETAAGADGDIVRVRRTPKRVSLEHTVTAGEAAVGDGTVNLDTGLGIAPRVVKAQVRSSAGVVKSGYNVTKLSGGSAGTVRVAGNGTTSVAADDVIAMEAEL